MANADKVDRPQPGEAATPAPRRGPARIVWALRWHVTNNLDEGKFEVFNEEAEQMADAIDALIQERDRLLKVVDEADDRIRDILDVLVGFTGRPIADPQARLDYAVEALNDLLPLGDAGDKPHSIHATPEKEATPDERG